MKKLLIICVIGVSIISCKEEVIQPKINSIAEDLKQVIESKNVEALGYCCVGCTCGQTIGLGADYSFPGDNFVRIQAKTYNLNRMVYYTIEVFGVAPDTEKRLVLYFPQE